MRKEQLKTLALILLVIVSCVLTYKSWSYKPEFETVDTTLSLPPMAAQGEAVSIESVVPTYQVIYIKDDVELGTMDKDLMTQLRDELKEHEIKDVKSAQNINELKADAFVEDEVLLLDYYVEIPSRLFFQMLDIEIDDKFVDFNFDRVFVELQNKHIVFNLLNKERTEFVTYEIDVPTKNISALLIENEGKFVDYSMIISNAATSNQLTAIYGPTTPGRKKIHQFIPSTLSVSTMNQTLFTSKDIDQKQSDDFTVYESDTAIATYTSSNYQYAFMNLKEGEHNKLSPHRTIEKSFIFLNGHMGLTSRFILFGYDDGESTVDYRTTLNNYVVFSDEIMSEINVTIGQNTISEYSRPMIQANANIPTDLSVELDDIEEVRYQIALHDEYKLSKVSKIILAYDLKHNEEQSELNVIEYTPAWYILYDDEWVKYDIGEDM